MRGPEPSSNTERKPFVVVAAMREELFGIVRSLERPGSSPIRGCRTHSGRLLGRSVVVACTGDGAQAATRGLGRVLESQSCRAVVVIGVAGGLSPDLECGDVVVCSEVEAEDGSVVEMDPDLIAQARRYPPIKIGSTVSAEHVAVTETDKRCLWLKHGSRPNQVVDLESVALSTVAQSFGLPCLVIRFVSDGPNERLPIDFNRFRNSDGGIDRARVLRQVIRRPHLMPELLRLRNRVRSGALELVHVVREVVAS
ncbi:MAG: hypothetical protein P8Y44_00430 [Acidobacteriota bacterium]